MVKTLNLVGLGSNLERERSYYIFETCEEFQKYFNEILEKIHLDGRIYDEQLPLSERKNEVDYFKNDEFDLDVIYSQDRIIVIVRANPQNLEKFKRLVLVYSNFIY